MLSDFTGDREEGFLFETRTGNMLSPESFYRNGLKTIFRRMGSTGVRFNAFRRFRESVLLKSECRQILIDYWMGHENPDMSTRYGKQVVEDIAYRKAARLTSASMQTVSSGASTLKPEQTSRSRTCPSRESPSSRNRCASTPDKCRAAANRSAGLPERIRSRCSSMSSGTVKLSPSEVYKRETKNGHPQLLEKK